MSQVKLDFVPRDRYATILFYPQRGNEVNLLVDMTFHLLFYVFAPLAAAGRNVG
jgi:hypothetical protein